MGARARRGAPASRTARHPLHYWRRTQGTRVKGSSVGGEGEVGARGARSLHLTPARLKFFFFLIFLESGKDVVLFGQGSPRRLPRRLAVGGGAMPLWKGSPARTPLSLPRCSGDEQSACGGREGRARGNMEKMLARDPKRPGTGGRGRSSPRLPARTGAPLRGTEPAGAEHGVVVWATGRARAAEGKREAMEGGRECGGRVKPAARFCVPLSQDGAASVASQQTAGPHRRTGTGAHRRRREGRRRAAREEDGKTKGPL